MRLHIDRRGIHRRVGIQGINPRHLPWRGYRIMRRDGNAIGTNHLHHGGISRLGNGRECPRCRHGKSRNDIGRIGALSPQLFLNGLLGHARTFHRLAKARGSLQGTFLGGPCGTILERQPGCGELLRHDLDILGCSNAVRVRGPIITVAIAKRLTRLLDGLAPRQFLPRTVESARDLAASLAFEKATGVGFEGGNVSDDFFGHGLFFGGGVDFAVGYVGAGGYEGAEAFVSGVGCDVDSASGEDVAVGDDDGGFGVLLMGWVTRHDYVCLFFDGCCLRRLCL
mmetsp:Transcript_23031/g.49860  ORF Transcript_23031/g.49860 Transcript_23031/m.49860 type:complete len:282 (+) Transcript_23031:848-1693(+)